MRWPATRIILGHVDSVPLPRHLPVFLRGGSPRTPQAWPLAWPLPSGQRRITADTALRLSRYFGTSERFWLNLQARYDLEVEKDRLGAALDDIRPLSAAS